MSDSAKKVLAILVTVIVIFGWFVTIFGIGGMAPITEKIKLGLDIQGGMYVVMEAQTDETGEDLKKLMEQTQAVIENRVNQLGLSEPVVTIEGEKRIRVELPGAEDAQEAIESIGKTAQLQFCLADGTVMLDGGDVKDAGVGVDDQNGGYSVTLQFSSEGSKKFEEATYQALHGNIVSAYDGVPGNAVMIILDGEILSSPVPSSVISQGNAEITRGGSGGFDQEYATNLSALIRGGALPVSLEEIETSTQTATIGYDALEKSVRAGIIGILLIFAIMLIAYRFMGICACLALALYVALDLWALALFGAVLTLPGIAGIILSIGMAVDGNVIIFTRIREEMAIGKSIRVAVQSGYKHALSTIIDSQVTTIIAALVLYEIGSSSVKGFALTLMIGIIFSVFTSVCVTQLYLGAMSGTKLANNPAAYGMRKDGQPSFALKKKFDFITKRKLFYCVSVAVIVVGLVVGVARGYNFGIDFTGGTRMQVDLGQTVTTAQVTDALEEFDLHPTIQFLGEGNEQVMIKTTVALDNAEREQVINALHDSFGISGDDVLSVEQFGPSVGKELQKNAVKAVLIALIGMLIYIIFRFEWKFGVAAIVGQVHDVLFVIALYGLLHFTINNPFIAGILTLVGYSINDTIVVFDRIRENIRFMKKSHTKELVNVSVNQTLSRSIMTSVTTLIVMIPLYVFAGSAIREFMMPLIIGVIVGCASTLFIASPLYYEICQMMGGSKYKGASAKSSRKSRQKETEVLPEEAAAVTEKDICAASEAAAAAAAEDASKSAEPEKAEDAAPAEQEKTKQPSKKNNKYTKNAKHNKSRK